jgi:hypothetical protein
MRLFSIQAKQLHEGGIQKFKPVWGWGKHRNGALFLSHYLSVLRLSCGTRALPVEEALISPSELLKLLGTLEI